MPRLHYLTEQHAQELVTTLTEQVFPDSPAFQLRGSEGRHALLSALDQPRWPYYRTLPEKAGVLHYSLNKNHPFADGNRAYRRWFERLPQQERVTVAAEVGGPTGRFFNVVRRQAIAELADQ